MSAFLNTNSIELISEYKLERFLATSRIAVDKRDHAAMLEMMPNDFSDGGGLTAPEWL